MDHSLQSVKILQTNSGTMGVDVLSDQSTLTLRNGANGKKGEMPEQHCAGSTSVFSCLTNMAAGCQQSVREVPHFLVVHANLINTLALFSRWYIKIKINWLRPTVFHQEPLAPEGMDSIMFTVGYSNPIYFLMPNLSNPLYRAQMCSSDW